MKIMNNSAAMMALGELKKNDKSLSKQQKKVGTGMKIVGAGDGASEYAISERMRTNIRALNQATDNVTTGKNMINLASAAIDQQVSLMRQIAARTMQASDDTYNDNDRATLNKEISHLLDQSDDIARQTTYNGIHLLDQTRISDKGGAMWFDADAPYHLNKGNIQAMTSLTSTGSYSPPSGSYYTISTNPPNTYDPNQKGAGADYTSLPSVGDTVWNKTTNQQDKVAKNAAGDLVFVNTQAPVSVNGKTNGTQPAATSTNVATVTYTSPYTTVPANGTAVVYKNGSSFLQGTVATSPGSNLPSVLVSNTGYYTTEVDFSSLFQPGLTIPADLDGVGFSLDCGGCQQFVTVVFDASRSNSILSIASKSTRSPKPLCYVIGVSKVQTQQDLEQAIFNGIATESRSNPPITGSNKVTFATLPSTTDAQASIADRHDIMLNYYASTGKFTISKYGPSITIMNGVMGEMVETQGHKPDQLLKIQSSSKGSQNTTINLPNTTLSILFPQTDSNWDIRPREQDYPSTYSADYSNCKNETEKQLQWKDTEWPYPSKFVDGFDKDHTVDTREKASAFLDNVHQAIKYLLYSNTTLGAQANRMNYTAANLVNTVENTQASESTIRDADMAKEMTNYVKSNVLAQSAQAMLAQANQNSSSVLSLLQ